MAVYCILGNDEEYGEGFMIIVEAISKKEANMKAIKVLKKRFLSEGDGEVFDEELIEILNTIRIKKSLHMNVIFEVSTDDLELLIDNEPIEEGIFQ